MVSKKLFFLFSILLCMVGTKALAYDIAVQNADGVTIYYNFLGDGLEVVPKIDDYLSTPMRDDYSGSIVIPEEVRYMSRTLKVKSIGMRAFLNCNDLHSVTIPNSVTSLGSWAFENCMGLTSITIPNSVTTIGEYTFHGCMRLTSISIPNSVTYIGGHAFDYCNGLTSITIPNSVTSIEWYTFSFCENLTSVTIPNSVTSIGIGAFADCSSLTSITIPNSVTSIGNSAFSGCSSLTSITIDVQTPFSISENVFSSDTYTTATLTVPSGTKAAYQSTEGWNQFSNIIESGPVGPDNSPFAVEIDGIYYRHDWFSDMYSDAYGVSVSSPNPGSNTPYYSGDVVIPSEINYRYDTWRVRAIDNHAFANCYNLSSISFPEPGYFGGIDYIGNSAFYGCSGLTSITIPNSVTTIGDGAFAGCI